MSKNFLIKVYNILLKHQYMFQSKALHFINQTRFCARYTGKYIVQASIQKTLKVFLTKGEYTKRSKYVFIKNVEYFQTRFQLSNMGL